jgi:hypothetical protein
MGRDGLPVRQALRWPEVDRQVRTLPSGVKKLYVRYRLKEMGMDHPRLAVLYAVPEPGGVLDITHEWFSDGERHAFTEHIQNPRQSRPYRVNTGTAKEITNLAITLYRPPQK